MNTLLRSFLVVPVTAAAFFTAVPAATAGEVTIEQLDDRFRVSIDGELFTEWQLKAWKVPYLYPVIGPNGENITRHYPMKDGVAGESQDHPHHRSIRFSHRKVNGLSFWAPDNNTGDRTCSIVLDKVEKMQSGETGELIFWNNWIGDDKQLLRERVHLVFHPLADREVLMDYDNELFADDVPVTFEDDKDGGMGIRVAATMRVEDRKEKGAKAGDDVSKVGQGTIVNSDGLMNDEAWGKRAKWCDYSGPDASGKTVGVAIFDHPSNLRFPTHWHARTYGLLTANRFGKGVFEKSSGATLGEGDYTIEPGKSLALRHRFFFHHGDAAAADVAAKYSDYEQAK